MLPLDVALRIPSEITSMPWPKRVATKPAFREALQRRRCLVPTLVYKCQKTADGKQPYAIGLAGSSPIASVGLWERWKDSAAGKGLASATESYA